MKKKKERHGVGSPRCRGGTGQSRADGAAEGAGRSPDAGVAAVGRGRGAWIAAAARSRTSISPKACRWPVGGAPTTALVGEGTAGSPQPSPISTGKFFKRPKGRAGQDGVQPKGTEVAGPGAGPGSGGLPFRLCTTADRPGEEVAAAGDMLGGRRSGAGGLGMVSGGGGGAHGPRPTAHGHGGLGTMPPALQFRGRRNLGRRSPHPMPRPHAGREAGAGATTKVSPSFGARCQSQGARTSST